MTSLSVSRAIALACLAVVLHVPAASAGDNEAGQTPPPAQAQDSGQTTPAEKPACVSDDAQFYARGNKNTFEVALRNSCEVRIRCTVNAYIVSAFGPKLGEKVLELAPKSKGAAAQQTFVMTVKQAGGSATVSRSCKEL